MTAIHGAFTSIGPMLWRHLVAALVAPSLKTSLAGIEIEATQPRFQREGGASFGFPE